MGFPFVMLSATRTMRATNGKQPTNEMTTATKRVTWTLSTDAEPIDAFFFVHSWARVPGLLRMLGDLAGLQFGVSKGNEPEESFVTWISERSAR